jgi:phosphohistidine phosphatase SixA
LAKASAIEPIVVSSKDMAGLVARIKAQSGNLLVVGHSNTVPEIVKALGGEAVAIGDSDYDNLFVLTATQSLRLHYR